MANCGFSNGFSSGFAVCAGVDVPPQSGVGGAQVFATANNIDPILASRPEGAPIRALRRTRRALARRLRE